jgi:hypothetical protein
MTWSTFIRLDTGEHSTDDPIDTVAKRIAASNLRHHRKSHGQVLANWALADGDGITRGRNGTTSGGRPLWESGLIYRRTRPDGTLFPVRVKLRGRITSTGTATFIVYVGRAQETFVTSSTTGAWLTAGGIGDVDGLLRDDNVAPIVTVSSPQSIGADPITFDDTATTVRVYVSSVVEVELTGVYAAEVHGV